MRTTLTALGLVALAARAESPDAGAPRATAPSWAHDAAAAAGWRRAWVVGHAQGLAVLEARRKGERGFLLAASGGVPAALVLGSTQAESEDDVRPECERDEGALAPMQQMACQEYVSAARISHLLGRDELLDVELEERRPGSRTREDILVRRRAGRFEVACRLDAGRSEEGAESGSVTGSSRSVVGLDPLQLLVRSSTESSTPPSAVLVTVPSSGTCRTEKLVLSGGVPAQLPEPLVSTEVAVGDDRFADETRATVEAVEDDVFPCYERARRTAPALRGLVKAYLRLGSSGRVAKAELRSDTTSASSLAQCLLRLAGRLTFSNAEQVKDLTVTWHFRGIDAPDAGGAR